MQREDRDLIGYEAVTDNLCADYRLYACLVVVAFSIALGLTANPAQAQVNVLTAHNDIARTGQNLNETTLTPGNVNSNQFGKLFSQPVNGGISAQPLYVSSVPIPGKGSFDVVYAATIGDIVYAFDANSNGGVSANPLWQTSLLTTGPSLSLNYGVVGTPVIDPSTETMYLVSSEYQGSTPVFRIHALNITNGTEKFGGPYVIQASVPGTGTASSNGVLTFNALYAFQRPALLLLNGVVYVSFGSYGDNGPYHGWILSFAENSLQMIDAFCTTAYGSEGGLWMSGAGPAAEINDPAKPYGRMFVATANGSYALQSPTVGGQLYSNPQNQLSMSVLNLDLTGGNMTVMDAFTTFNWASLNNQDGDLGSSGPVLLPTQTLASGKILHSLIQIGKTGAFYILDRDTNADGSNNPSTEYSPAGLGGFNAGGNQIVQQVQTPISGANNWGAGVWGTEAYWNNNIYAGGTNVGNSDNTGGTGNSLTAYSFVNGVLSSTPTSQSQQQFTFPGPTPSISANGNSNGIVWVLKNDGLNSSGYEALLAYNANNLGQTLYSSDTNLARDNPGFQLPFNVPTIANGKVYVGSQSTSVPGQLSVYGLFGSTPTAPAPTFSPGSTNFNSALTVSIGDALGGATIYYTTDGSTPTANSAVYTGPINISSDETLTAIASANNYIQSLPASATFVSTAVPNTPVFSLAAGSYAGAQTLTMTDSTPGAILYYTTDGSAPSTSSAIYSQPLSIAASSTVKAVAYSPGPTASAVASATYSIQPNYNIDFSQGFSLADGPMQFNGSTDLDDFRLQLTNGGLNEAGSAFYATRVNIQKFTTRFTFQLSNPAANGITFTIQNSGANALGGMGGGLGYGGIPQSVAIKFDLWNSAGEGSNSTGLYINGAQPTVPAINLNGTGINLHDGDYIDATMTYDGTTLIMTLVDEVTLASWTQPFAVNIPAVIGSNTAYVGFTGSTGALSASQKINSWVFVSGQPLPNYAAGFQPGALALNRAPSFNGGALELTDGGLIETRSAFFNVPENVQAFTTSFNFQLTNAIADGFTFTIQGNNPTALGPLGNGGGLGYTGMPLSVAIKFDMFNNSGEGSSSTGIYLDGASPTVPAIDLTSSGIDLHSGHIFNAQLTYDGTTLTAVITDTVTGAWSTVNYSVDIPAVIGGPTGYVGFTAASGGFGAVQQILNWSYTPMPVTGPAFTHGFFSAQQLALNGGAGLNGNMLELTDGNTYETRSAFFNTPVNVQQFSTSFDLMLTDATADGCTFTIQGVGPYALGSGGGGLGYAAIPNSLAIKFDLFSNAGEGPDSTGLYTGGAGPTLPAINLSSSGVNLHRGDLFNVQMNYNGSTLVVVITDTVTNASATQSYTVNIPATVGGATAYIGFTAASGGFGAVQQVLNWTYN